MILCHCLALSCRDSLFLLFWKSNTDTTLEVFSFLKELLWSAFFSNGTFMEDLIWYTVHPKKLHVCENRYEPEVDRSDR